MFGNTMISKTSVIVTFVTIAALTGTSFGRDPTFAIEANVPLSKDTSAVYRIVSLGWIKYLTTHANPTIWLHVENLPVWWNGRNLTNASFREKQLAKYEITKLAREILQLYITRGFRVTTATRFLTHIDPNGVTMNMLPERYRYRNNDIRIGRRTNEKVGVIPTNSDETVDLANFKLNRTIVISFEDPPYGQSRTNRLVTNRNIKWHNSPVKRYQLTNRYTKIDTTDLRYRYAHNLGHLLGFGHYLRLVRQATGLPSSWSFYNNIHGGRWQEDKSVMFADTKNSKHSSQYVTFQDLYVIRYVAKNIDSILENTVNRILKTELPKTIIDSFKQYGKYLIN